MATLLPYKNTGEEAVADAQKQQVIQNKALLLRLYIGIILSGPTVLLSSTHQAKTLVLSSHFVDLGL